MLTTAERLRIEDKLVVPYTVTWREYEQTYEPKLVWVGADTDTISDSEFKSYPAIVAEFNSRGAINDAEDGLNGFTDRSYDAESDVLSERRERPQSGELSLTVVTTTSFDNEATPPDEMGIPPQVRSEDITSELWDWANFEANAQLNMVGENGERPMTVEPVSSPTPARVEDTVRMQFSIEVAYTQYHNRELDYADTTKTLFEMTE